MKMYRSKVDDTWSSNNMHNDETDWAYEIKFWLKMIAFENKDREWDEVPTGLLPNPQLPSQRNVVVWQGITSAWNYDWVYDQFTGDNFNNIPSYGCSFMPFCY